MGEQREYFSFFNLHFVDLKIDKNQNVKSEICCLTAQISFFDWYVTLCRRRSAEFNMKYKKTASLAFRPNTFSAISYCFNVYFCGFCIS